MKLSDLKNDGHWPTLLAAFLYFDFGFMVRTVLGPLGAQIGETLGLSAGQKGLMIAVPILAGAVLRILLGLLVDRVGAKNAGIMAQLVVISGLALAWIFGLPNFEATLLVGLVLGFAGASFAVALPQAGSYQFGFLIFASLCFLAIVGLSLVKTRWRSTWGALAGARI